MTTSGHRSDRGFLAGGGEMGALMRSTDWSRTPLGEPEGWSPALRTMVSVLLANRFPLLLWWGPDYASIYNDAYRPILGMKHPRSLGQPVRECWEEIWHILRPLIDTPFGGGPATWMEDILLEINRHGFVEETHFTIAYSPVPDDTAPRGIGGVLATVHEITEKVIAERRVTILRELGTRVAEAKTAANACENAAGVLAECARDIPFALLYLIEADGRHACLCGTAGISAGGPGSPGVVPLQEEGGRAAAWPFRQALRANAMQVVENLEARLPEEAPGPWSDAPNTAVVLPIPSSKAHQAAGFLVAGLSPRLRLDQQYRSFLELATAQIATAIGNARAYEEERRRAEALAEIDRAKTLFFSNVSHEFRTPLTLMLGPLEDALSSKGLPERERERLDVAHRNSLRLLKLVNSLLDFSRIEAGRAQAMFEPVDLAALTAELASNFRSACERAGLTLTVDCPRLQEPVYVDRDMWEKIVLNLLSNAFKFTFEGGIEVRLRAAEGCAELSVADTGAGIPGHELPRLFERFHRIEGQRSRTHEGSGIGLALAQELVKLHGGTIFAESQQGRGTTFTVRLPFGTAHLTQGRIAAARSAASTSVRTDVYVQEAMRWLGDAPASEAEATRDADGSAAIPSMPEGTRVLVADDNSDMRAYIQRLLRPHCEVEAVADGDEALAAVRERRPDLLLADVMMPRLDGFGLLRAIRDDAALREMPVIMLSARAGEESRVEGMQAGADDYLIKPFSARELLARVEAHVKAARFRRDATQALRESEERLRAFVSASSDVVYRMSPDWTEMRQLRGKHFIADSEDANRAWLQEYIFPEDQSHVTRTIADAVRNKSIFELEHRVRRVDGTVGWTLSRAIPLLDDKGEIIEWFGAASDVTARKEAEEQLKLLVAELNHRVKNTLATVQSIARQTLRSAATAAEASRSLESRLVALSKAHDVLTREHWEGAHLHELVTNAISAFSAKGGEDRFRVDGSDLKLQPKAAVVLSMALHELATNAAKYGALSNGAGQVRIAWDIVPDEPERFSLRWTESGGPPVQEPSRRGFGSRLIEQGLAHDIDGDARLSFTRDGLVCSIVAPIGEIRVDGA